MLVTLPFALLLLEFWPLRRWPQTPAKKTVASRKSFFRPRRSSSLVTYLVQESGGRRHFRGHLEPHRALGNAVVSYVRYAGMSFWPLDLCVIYPHPRTMAGRNRGRRRPRAGRR